MALSLMHHVFKWRSLFWKLITKQKCALFISLACFLPRKCHWYKNAFFHCSLHLKCPVHPSPLATPMHFTKPPPYSSCMASHSHCQPTTTGKRIGQWQVPLLLLGLAAVQGTRLRNILLHCWCCVWPHLECQRERVAPGARLGASCVQRVA